MSRSNKNRHGEGERERENERNMRSRFDNRLETAAGKLQCNISWREKANDCLLFSLLNGRTNDQRNVRPSAHDDQHENYSTLVVLVVDVRTEYPFEFESR